MNETLLYTSRKHIFLHNLRRFKAAWRQPSEAPCSHLQRWTAPLGAPAQTHMAMTWHSHFLPPQTPATQDPGVWSLPFNCHLLGGKQFSLNCEQRHFVLDHLLRMPARQIAQEIRGHTWCLPAEQRAGVLTVQYNEGNVIFQGKGQAGLLPTRKNSDTLSSGFLCCDTTHYMSRVTWPALFCTVGTGTWGSGENADTPIIATLIVVLWLLLTDTGR